MHHRLPHTLHARRAQQGFTLIELLVASSILIMLMLAATAMLMTSMLNQARGSIRAQVKAEGEAMVQRIEFNLRGAGEYTQCASNTISYKKLDDASGEIYTIERDGATGLISINSGTATALHSENVAISNFVLSCTQNASTKATVVTLSFTASNNATNRQVDLDDTSVISEDFRRVIELRNYL